MAIGRISQHELSERQRREIDFYEQYAECQRVEAIDFAPVLGLQTRPWNSYWYVYEQVAKHYRNPQQKLLDFGCGIGIAAIRFAHLGYQVEGFDISHANLAVAEELAERYHFKQQCRFRVMTAENLDYPDNTFDVITGIDILHHIEIPRAIAEAHRVLKPGGVAIFKEHIETPLIDTLRNSRLGKWIASTETSLENHITEDERKLTDDDVSIIGHQFGRMDSTRFTLISHIDRLFSKSNDRMRGILQRLDYRLMGACPALKRFGGTVVLLCHKQPAWQNEQAYEHAA